MLQHGIVPWLVFAVVVLSTTYLTFPSDTFIFVPEQESLGELVPGRIGNETEVEPEQLEPPWANLHLLMPATAPDPNLCRAMISAQISGYPSPVILNWGLEFNKNITVGGGTHLAKIKGAYRFLNDLDSSHDDDLVVMIDSYDIWLQLRPQVLIDRYFSIIDRANVRIRQELGDDVARTYDIRQRIVIGAEKRCWPWRWSDPPCYAAPESTLPRDIYGPDTDHDFKDRFGGHWSHYRPRYLNSGLMIGDVAAMRRMFERASFLLAKESNMGSDQWIFAHIFGDQEIYRGTLVDEDTTVKRMMNLNQFNEVKNMTESRIRQHIKEVRAKAAQEGNLDYGIGLDLESELTVQTGHALDDSWWFARRDTPAYQRSLAAMHLGSRPPLGPEEDVARSIRPFWNLENGDVNTEWEDVPLYTNLYTGISPVAVHHNGMKGWRKEKWNETWFAPHARDLFDAQMKAPQLALGFNRREFWPFEKEKAGGRDGLANPATRFLKFEEMCAAHHAELWLDGKGPWARRDLKKTRQDGQNNTLQEGH